MVDTNSKMDYNFSSYQNGAAKDADFQKLSNTIGTSIQKISQNVSSMQKMVNQLGTPQESQQLKNQLQELQHYTKQLVKDTAAHVQDLKRIPNPPTASESREWKLKRERLTDDFTTALNDFQQAQRNAIQKEKESLQRGRASSGYGIGLEPPSSGSNLIELQDSRQQKFQYLEDEANVQMLEEQERGIRRLEDDVEAVNDIFKSLGQLVHDQGEVVESIEAHVEMATNQVNEAAEQLRIASRYQNKVRKNKLCLLITGIVVVTVLILIIVFTTR